MLKLVVKKENDESTKQELEDILNNYENNEVANVVYASFLRANQN